MHTLPEMTVEKTDRLETAHGLRAPIAVDSEEYKKELSDTVELCQGAKIGTFDFKPWGERVKEILAEHAPFELAGLESTLFNFGFQSWADCTDFVMNDNCDDFAGMVLVYTQQEKIPHTRNRGFIDGDGIGFKRRYIDRLSRKGDAEGNGRGTLEKAFDAKYFYRLERPLLQLHKALGRQAGDCIVNYVHPGHYAYPAGHASKFFEVVDLARDTWELSGEQDLAILTAAYVLAMARSGGGVHTPQDQLAGGYLAGLPEFAFMGE